MTRNNIHRQQLFHWIGGDIEGYKAGKVQIRRRLSDIQRKQYLDHLTRALRDGLWMKLPRVPEKIEAGVKDTCIDQKLPVTCFTEWTLNLSAPHSAKYGRLGLGFSKNWVMSRGGQPVTYFKCTGTHRWFAKAAVELSQFLEKHPKLEERNKLLMQFRYMVAFSRAVKSPVIPITERSTTRSPKIQPREKMQYLRVESTLRAIPEDRRVKTAPIALAPPNEPDHYERRFGVRLDLAEEREWRIVFNPELLKKNILTTGSYPPDYFVPFTPGKELFTVVLPDNRTVSMAMQKDEIREELFAADRPHVTILSFEDIGTF